MEIQNPFQISWDTIPHKTFSDFFFASIAKYGGSLAMVDHESNKQWRYSEIKDWTEKCVLRLKEIGVNNTSRVALITTTTVEVIFVHLACSMLGAIVVCVNAYGSVDEIWSYVDAAEATHAICETSLIAKVEDVRKKAILRGAGRIKIVKSLDDVLCDSRISTITKQTSRLTQRTISCADMEGALALLSAKDDEEAKEKGESLVNGNTTHDKGDTTVKAGAIPFMLIFSSGTVGTPKPIIYHQQSLIVNLLQLVNPLFDYPQPKDRFLLPLSIHHLFGIVSAYYALYCGSTLVCMQKFALKTAYEAIQKHKITHIHLTPFMVYSMATDPQLESSTFESVKSIITAGAPLDVQMARKVKGLTKVKDMRQVYGISELGGIFTWSHHGCDKVESVGVPLPGMLMKVINLETKALCFPRQQGHLFISGPQIIPAFYKNPKAVLEFIDTQSYYRTGDAAWYDEDGYIHIVDRIKDMIKCKNVLLCPSDVEGILREHPGIDDCAVVGRPDHMSGECPAAFVVKNAAYPLLSTAEVRQHVAGQIATFKELRGGVFFISEIPRSFCGKVLRRYLKQFWDRERQGIAKETTTINGVTIATSVPVSVVKSSAVSSAKRLSVASSKSITLLKPSSATTTPVKKATAKVAPPKNTPSKPTTKTSTSKLPSNLHDIHFSFAGHGESDYAGGVYHGRILLPADYPMHPPDFFMCNLSGRFHSNAKICLSNTSFHPDEWSPAFGIQTAIMGFISVFYEESPGGIGSIKAPPFLRRNMAQHARRVYCAHCNCYIFAVQKGQKDFTFRIQPLEEGEIPKPFFNPNEEDLDIREFPDTPAIATITRNAQTNTPSESFFDSTLNLILLGILFSTFAFVYFFIILKG
uniref:UBIQUITIN_CONJUGAT_2 domain-containing protein n=1 Tax=Rhabditophanes sp. KR3021 TaxID=114890 RepID=A0AC35TYF5_9BILA